MKKGQQFTVFKMLMGAVFAVALLAIVIGLNKQMESPQDTNLFLKNLAINANQGQNLCFAREKILVIEGEIYSGNLNTPLSISYDVIDKYKNIMDCSNNECKVLKDAEIYASVKCTKLNTCKVCFGSRECKC